MDVIVFVRRQKGSMENGMNLPGFWERESVIERVENFGDEEWSFSFRGQLLALISEFEVFRF